MDGKILDTLFTPAPCTIVDYMPSPNDKLLLLRTYKYTDWYVKGTGRTTYFIYDIEKNLFQDSIIFENSKLNFESLKETIWSPNSERTLLFSIGENNEQAAFIYKLGGEKTLVGRGTNFIWSPVDEHLVSYLNANTIFFKNVLTNETTEFYKGQKDKKINDFRWSPTGEYLVINLHGYFMNIASKTTWKPSRIFISAKDKWKSKEIFEHTVFESWK